MSVLRSLVARLRWRAPEEVGDLVRVTRRDWNAAGRYYAEAESDQAVAMFWSPESQFRRLFESLDPTRIVELACGHGRHSWQMRDWPNQKTLVDFVEANIDFCRTRFATVENVSFVVNNGRDLAGLPDSSASALFSYDAMVHFDHTIVRGYVTEAARVLAPNGMALFHHSNYPLHRGRHYVHNPHRRAWMEPGLMTAYVRDAGLELVNHQALDWGHESGLDAVTLCRKR